MRFGFAALILATTSIVVAQDNSPRYRGVGGRGVAQDDARLPSTWSKTDNVAWSIDVPGQAWSCPVIWGDKVFLTSVVDEEENTAPTAGLYLGGGVREPNKGIHHWVVYCYDVNSGEKLWEHEAHTGRPTIPRHPKSSYGCETPTTDGERLYVLFGDVGLYAYDFDGEQVWARDIEPKQTIRDYGAAASPVLHDGQLIVVYDNVEDSWLASFDAETGSENWRTSRDEQASWATPLIWENELRTEIIVNGVNKNRSYDLDGKLLWEFDGDMSNLVIPSPFAAHGMLYVGSGYVGDKHRPTFAIRPGASGDFTPEGEFTDSEFIEWYQGTSCSYNPSQIVYGDYLYTLYDFGFITCHDARTGEEVYGKQRFEPKGSFTAAPWAYNGKLFCLSEQGLTYTIEPGPDFKIVATSDLDELCMATPSVAGGRLFIRTLTKLYCITNDE